MNDEAAVKAQPNQRVMVAAMAALVAIPATISSRADASAAVARLAALQTSSPDVGELQARLAAWRGDCVEARALFDTESRLAQ
jgi:hypothetical protein